ncbi:hypothetical protein AX16_001407 [Volvariella volvacea WC 439]|nr:hypothetical protein AX16_001407 [Volvariella volvacea WC 439]
MPFCHRGNYRGQEHAIMYYRRAPSRFLWFFIGAASAAAWIKHSEMRDRVAAFKGCVRSPLTSEKALELQKKREDDMEKIKAMTQEAAEAMSEISEVTLDSAISTLGAVKARVAEYRAERAKAREQPPTEQLRGQAPETTT